MKKKPAPTHGLLQIMLASPSEPTPQFMRDHQLMCMHSALESITRGSDPGVEDWRALCDAINMMETMLLNGKVADDEGVITAASLAMKEAAERSQQGKGLRLSGPGIESMCILLDAYRDVIETYSHRTMLMCHRETEARLREIQAGKKQAHDVEIVSL